MDNAGPPQPEGAVYFSYNPMSPPLYDLVPFNVHVYVYRDVTVAMRAMQYWVERIWAKQAAQDTQRLAGLPFQERLFFRGQPEITQRLLPTRLRGPKAGAARRQRFSYDTPAEHRAEIRRREGDWIEQDEEFRSMEDLLEHLSAEEMDRRVRDEQDAVRRAGTRLPVPAAWDDLMQRAAVRHYAGAPSSLLDVTIDLEIAAFFATGGGSAPASPGQYGTLWAIDLYALARLLSVAVGKTPGGWKVSLAEQREQWGVNKEILEKLHLPAVKLSLFDVDLPLPRPTAQKARFITLEGGDGNPLSTDVELIWWSLLERWAYPTAFIHGGAIYENPGKKVTGSALLPEDDPYLALAHTGG